MHLELSTIVVDDQDEAIAFFVGILGFELVTDAPSTTNDGRPKRWIVIRPPGAATGLLVARADGATQAAVVGNQFAGRVGFFLRVDDFEASRQRMVDAGVEFVGQPRTESYGQVVVFVDVAGNRWDLLGPVPSEDTPSPSAAVAIRRERPGGEAAARGHQITEPYRSGQLDVGHGHAVHWEVSGNPQGKPAVLLHGGPGGGSSPRHRQMFDPARYRIVQFDQRNCGRSTPSAADPVVDLSRNTTVELIADIEAIRTHLDIERWLVWGGSWGTTLGLAYAQAHPESVSELILAAVTTTTTREVEWVTRDMGRVFPEAWSDFVAALPPEDRDGNLALAYNRLLMNPDPAIHQPAADAWCAWEDVHVSIATGPRPSLTIAEPGFRLCFARLVTHYWANAGFLDDGQLVAEAGRLAGIPTYLGHGRRDISGPADIAVRLADAIPGAELFIAEEDGHGGPAMMEHGLSITDRLVASDPLAS